MPIGHSKLFQFNLATAYLLAGNYNDSKSRFWRCLETDPQGRLKAYLYNNLALACWWHKNPLEQIRDEAEILDREKVEKDFLQTKELLAKSVAIAEGLKR
jgi:tetratricopeptide (TPR) repeat protein